MEMGYKMLDLTKKERLVMSLLATGASNKEIAQKMHMAENTVKYHLTNIYLKLEVHSRFEATMMWRAATPGWRQVLYAIQRFLSGKVKLRSPVVVK